VTALLGYTGIDVNKADRDGQTPLHLAVIGFIRIAVNRYPDSITARLRGVLTALLGHAGIDVNKANNKHQTPLDLAARDTELVEVASVLRRHSEQQGALIGRMLASELMRSPRSPSALQDAVNAHPTLRTMQSQHPWFLPMLGALAEASLGGSAASDPLHSVQ
jgi:ankyrin repeat protein